MIQNGVYKLIKEATLPNGINFKVGQELEIVMDVVYVQGFPLPQGLQGTMLNWMGNNPTLFKNDTRNW